MLRAWAMGGGRKESASNIRPEPTNGGERLLPLLSRMQVCVLMTCWPVVTVGTLFDLASILP